mmetsp:Transcript_42065/g.46853  ORF Transcript_42065/g.46853 Transcript_42065/m.46853 type:complete len:208 (-) Transcript_42065:12-635(-)
MNHTIYFILQVFLTTYNTNNNNNNTNEKAKLISTDTTVFGKRIGTLLWMTLEILMPIILLLMVNKSFSMLEDLFSSSSSFSSFSSAIILSSPPPPSSTPPLLLVPSLLPEEQGEEQEPVTTTIPEVLQGFLRRVAETMTMPTTIKEPLQHIPQQHLLPLITMLLMHMHRMVQQVVRYGFIFLSAVLSVIVTLLMLITMTTTTTTTLK